MHSIKSYLAKILVGIVGAISLIGTSSFIAIPPSWRVDVVSADHGNSWHHNMHYQDSGSSRRVRAHGDAPGGDTLIDFYGAGVWVYDPSDNLHSAYSSACGVVNEGCPDNFYSPYSNWFPLFTGVWESVVHSCAHDSGHTLPGVLNPMGGSPCAGMYKADVHIDHH